MSSPLALEFGEGGESSWYFLTAEGGEREKKYGCILIAKVTTAQGHKPAR